MDLEIGDFNPPVGTERLEEFLDERWGNKAPRTYNKNHSILKDFFEWAYRKGKIHGNPVTPIPKAKARDVLRETFSESDEKAVMAAQEDVRDRLGLSLLFKLGLRKGALQSVQFKHFDHVRKRLTIFTKGGKVRELPIVEAAFWDDLGRLIIETEAQPGHYLLCRRKTIPHKRQGKVELDTTLYPDQPMGVHGLHDWWYRCLHRAGAVEKGVTRGERMHKARHTAGQRLLDGTRGNLKAVQRLLGHRSIQTTGDIYTDWDLDQLADVLRELEERK